MTTTSTRPSPKAVPTTILGSIAARWVLIVAATAVAFRTTWIQLTDEALRGTTGGYVLIMPCLAAVIAGGVLYRRAPRLPIHDRQTDIITSLLLLVIAIGINGMLMPRYSTLYQVMHLDVLAAWVFVCAACVAVFGLRVTSSYWPAWAMLFFASPIVYRVAVIEFGGTKFVAGLVTLVLTSLSVGFAARRRERILFAALAFGIGTAALFVVGSRLPDAPIGVSQFAPSILAIVLLAPVLYVRLFRHREVAVAPRNPVSAEQAGRGAIGVVIAAIVLALIPLPNQQLTPVSPGPPYYGTTTQIVPNGWTQISSVDYDWPTSYFGPTAVLRRQMLRADEADPRWDNLGRPRTVALQTLQARRVWAFEVYPVESTYNLGVSRVSPTEYVDLGHGVTAEYFTVVDDDLLVTWNLLSFIWTRNQSVAQRVSLLTVDNHEFDAPFPQPEPNTAANFRTILRVLLRGNATNTDTDPQYKDRDMLVEVGRDFVETQWDRS